MATHFSNSTVVCLLLMKFLFALHSCSVAISQEANGSNTNLFDHDKHKKIMGSILRWWQYNNITKFLDCKFRQTSIYTKKEIFNMIFTPEIKSFPCTREATTPQFYFIGNIRNGYLEGKGKLLFITDKEWSKVPPSKRKEMLALSNFHVCLKISNFQGKAIKKIEGTFKNGALHGMAKVSYMDNTLSIGSYKYGRAHGYRREFNQKHNLVDAGGYEIGWKKGCHWTMRLGHLLYQARGMFEDDSTPTIVFPIADDGSLDDPIAGDYFEHSCSLEATHKVQLIQTFSSNSSCLLNINYRLAEKENYTYSLCSKTKYPLLNQNEYNLLLCNINQEYKTDSVATRLENWFQSINKLLSLSATFSHSAKYSPLEVLWKLKPDLEKLDENGAVKLISDINLNIEHNTMTARVLGSPPVKIQFASGDVKLDNNMRPNGLNDIIIASENQHLVPRDKALGWSPTRIIGHFDHGSLNGFAFLQTNLTTFVWAMTKNGILHGPCLIWRISYIIEPVSLIIRLRLSNSKTFITFMHYIIDI